MVRAAWNAGRDLRTSDNPWLLVRSFASRIRTSGFRAALSHLQQRRSIQDERTAYAAWVRRTQLDANALSQLARVVSALPLQPRISVIVPVYNTPPDLLRSCIESVRRQAYTNWELCLADDASTAEGTRETLRAFEADPKIRIARSTVNQHISLASNAALALATGDFVAFLDHDDELAPEALAEVVRYINEHPDVDFVYSDEDKLDSEGAFCEPAFKPGWSPEFFLTCMYTCHLMVVRRRLAEEIGGFRPGYEGAQDYDLVLRLIERTERIGHVPKVLYHWRKTAGSTATAGSVKPWAIDAGRRALEDYARRNGLEAEVLPGGAAGLYRVRRRVRGEPSVSIVIPTTGVPGLSDGRGRDLLVQCLRSIRSKTAWPRYEVILSIDQEPRPEVLQALAGINHRVVRHRRDGAFNFSRKVNEAAGHAQGEHLVLFNDDLEVITAEWLQAMLEFSQETPVGAVGAKLIYPDGRLQHVGMLLGVAGVAAHAYHQHPGAAPGYMSTNICVRNCSAVTGACMMVRREVWREMGGFNEDLAVDFNDVDFCLRLRRAGYRIVYTPYAQLCHHESASFGARLQNPEEVQRMRELWRAAVESDPYYNPNLSPDTPDYRLRTA